MKPAILAIADDLTGALESGAKFAAEGIESVVITSLAAGIDCPAVVIDTESRHCSAEQASSAVRAAARFQVDTIYKKTDSTLRGNIAVELRALAACYPEHSITYIGAYPALGRTVRHGRLHVFGAPVDRTSFAGDPLNPVRESSIAALLESGPPCVIPDGESDADVASAVARAMAASPRRILAGPASVAAVLARTFAMPDRRPSPLPRVGRCLIVNGSRHPASVRQIDSALANGWVSLDENAAWRIIASPPQQPVEPFEFACVLARLVLAEVQRHKPDALLIFGGDTAFAILRALGSPALSPIGEILPGVPVSRAGGLQLITKAGGFGDDSLLWNVRRMLRASE